jgi:acyl carrier protein
LADILPEVKSLLAEVLGEDWTADQIGDDADIIQELGVDSIQLISFLLKIEDTFNVELDFDELDIGGLYSVRAFCEFLLAHDPARA